MLYNKISALDELAVPLFITRWLVLAVLVGLAAGSASAFFLVALDTVTYWRETHSYIIGLLPLAGLGIGLSYHYYGTNVIRGNNQLLDEFHSPQKVIPLRMAPLVLLGTLATHLFGGSAGREGTAVQMGGALADQLTHVFKFKPHDRKIILLTGISAGFASVFGTPLAGTVFALEVMVLGSLRYEGIFPALVAALAADWTCTHFWGVHHTVYNIAEVPALSPQALLYSLSAGALFGLAAWSFARSAHLFSGLFKKHIAYAPLRPVVGGALLAGVVMATGAHRYIGLGIPAIVESFAQPQPVWAFAVKILLTTFTLGAGFKGGEVTPLFFVGATLGSALSLVLPLPTALLAGMGFVAVFAGAANTPIACILMGLELFGTTPGVYMAIACITAYVFSGHTGIYGAQRIGAAKHPRFQLERGQKQEER
jgi:H+/Cl- antiporter ClcA